MILDHQNTFSDNQALAQAVGSYFSTNTLDLGASQPLPAPWAGSQHPSDPGRGEPKDLLVQLTANVTSAGAATLQVQLVQAAAVDASGVPQSPTVVCETAAVALADLKAGYQFRLAYLPHGISQRYLAVRYVIATAAITGGTVTAGLVADRQSTTV